MINGGYYIKARKIQESDIAFAPPHVREIWDWLIKEVNHIDSCKIKRGQTMRSLRDIQEGLRWYVGYRKEVYSKSKCEMATKWLTKRGMITTTKTTRGMIITVCNYEFYQDPKNYETNNETNTKPTRNQQPSDTINKNKKNVRNNKGGFEESFQTFWDTFHEKTGKQKTDKESAIKHWKKLSRPEQEKAIENVKPYFQNLSDAKYCKKARTYLSDKNFNDEFQRTPQMPSNPLYKKI